MLADMNVLVRHIRRLAAPSRYAKLNDRTLLDCFARQGDQDAFAALVNRHALLVAGVCRRVLANSHDVEDVFQNTFLTLALKAGKIGWHESVANWLHGVAHRLALRSRSNTIRREDLHEAARENMAARELDKQTQELRTILDAELSELADRLRLPLVLCYLEGRTRDEAARHCGWSLRTLERRLEQGRSLLRKRCLRHGLDLSVVLLVAALADQNASARGLLVAKTMDTLRAAISTGTLGSAVALQATHTVSLAAASYLKLAGGLSLMLTLAAFGTYAWSGHVSAGPSLVAEPNIPTLPIDDRKEPVPVTLPGQQGMPRTTARLGNGEFRATGVRKVQYSADGLRLLTVGSEGLRVFDAATGRILLIANPVGPTESRTSAISADGKFAALAGLSGASPGGIYDTSRGKLLCKLEIPAKRACYLAGFSRDGRLLASLVSEMCVDLYDTTTGKLVQTIQWKENFPPDEKHAHLGEIGFLPDGKSMLVSIHVSGNIRVFDIATGKETRQFTVTPRGIVGMVLSPDGQKLVALPNSVGLQPGGGSYDKPGGTAVVFATATGKRLGELQIPRISPSMMTIGPDNNTLFAGGSKAARTGIGRWDLTTGAYLDSVALPWPHQSDMPIAISPNGKTLVCFCDSTLHQIEIATGKEVVDLPGHHGPISSVCTSESHYVTGSEDGKVLLWDRVTGRLLFELGAPARSVRKILMDSEGDRLFALYANRNAQFDDPNLQAYRISDGKMIWQLHPPRRDHLLEGAASLALNGTQLAVLNSQSILYLDAETGRVVRSDPVNTNSLSIGQGPEIPSMMYSKQRGELLIWTADQLYRGAWLPGQKLMGPLPMQVRPFKFLPSRDNVPKSPVAFSPDGNLLALPLREHGIYFQEVTADKPPRFLKNSPQVSIRLLAFAPNSKELVFVPENGNAISLIDASTGKAINSWGVDGNPTALAYSEDGKSLVVGFDNSTALVWDLSKLPAAK
jgi:RNA polymerase sigma factor (sigma-70 family)